MPAIALEGQVSTGHGCFPPTSCIGPYANSSVRINGKQIQLRGISRYSPHTCGKTTHGDRIVYGDVPSTIFISGQAVAMIGDQILCNGNPGDRVAKGSENTFGG